MKFRPDDLAAVLECDPAVSDEEEAKKFHMGLHVVFLGLLFAGDGRIAFHDCCDIIRAELHAINSVKDTSG